MKKTKLTSLFLLLGLGGFSQNDSTEVNYCSVKKDGIYYAKYDSTTNIYIRFHEGDTAVTSSSVNNIKLVAKFINKDNAKEALVGKYFFNENTCNLRVKAKNEFGKVKMDGIVSGEVLALTVINKTENTARDFIFKYYALPEKKKE